MNFFKRKFYQIYVSWLKSRGDDKKYLRAQYYLKNGRTLNLDHPKEFMEKVQWLKLYKYTQDYQRFVDKYEVRSFVREKVGEEVLNPLYGVFDSVDEIDLDKLPEQFALKCTHASGTNLIVSDKSDVDWSAARAKLNRWMSANYYLQSRERIYKNIKPRIVVEKYLSELSQGVVDYKFYCFHGKPRYVLVKINEHGIDKKCYYTMQWQKVLPEKTSPDFLEREMPKPVNFADMIRVATQLCEGFIFIRIDLYSIKGSTLFGEMTFFPTGGSKRIFVERMNQELGDLITLPT